MYLREFSLGNFKAFGETQRLPIKPLTLIYGPNSGGKSSLIHGLLLAHEALNSEDGSIDVHRVGLGGESVDLGGFRQYVFRQEASRAVEWGFVLDATALSMADNLSGAKTVTLMTSMVQEHVEVKTGDELTPVGKPHASRYDVLIDDQPFLTMNWNPVHGCMDTALLNHRLPALRPLIKRLRTALAERGTLSAKQVHDLIDSALPDIHHPDPGLIPSGLELGDPTLNTRAGTQRMVKALAQVLHSNSRKLRMPKHHEPYAGDAFEEINALIQDICQLLEFVFRKAVYLGPLRSFPSRSLSDPMRLDPNYRSGGAATWDALKQSLALREEVNRWLGSDFMKTRYKLELRVLYDRDEMRVAAQPGMLKVREPGRAVDRFTAAVAPRAFELSFVDLRTGARVSHRDIGIGISQVLPVVVIATAATNSLVMVEQPEIHLHPALQAELGDLLVESAMKRGNTLLIETHSEHVLLRIQRRIRETTVGKLPVGVTPLTTRDVQVVYVEPTKSGSRVLSMELDEDGQLVTPWPGGFFEEGFRERFSA
jgi:hypothetical protein